jgi:hypothetical protein
MSDRLRHVGTNAAQVLGMVERMCSILTARPRV